MRAKKYKHLLRRETVFDTMPEGWLVINGAQTAPKGYVWIYNGKSVFSNEYRHALCKL